MGIVEITMPDEKIVLTFLLTKTSCYMDCVCLAVRTMTTK